MHDGLSGIDIEILAMLVLRPLMKNNSWVSTTWEISVFVK